MSDNTLFPNEGLTTLADRLARNQQENANAFSMNREGLCRRRQVLVFAPRPPWER